jgi:hypothetical protein
MANTSGIEVVLDPRYRLTRGHFFCAPVEVGQCPDPLSDYQLFRDCYVDFIKRLVLLNTDEEVVVTCVKMRPTD